MTRAAPPVSESNSNDKEEDDNPAAGTTPLLTEASCASIAAAAACFLLYPLEVHRTRSQAELLPSQESTGLLDDHMASTSARALLASLLAEYTSHAVFLRVAYILLCSFLYSYISEFLKRRVQGGARARREEEEVFSWGASFACSSVACVLTVLLTQALDSYIYRSQVDQQHALGLDNEVCGWEELHSSPYQDFIQASGQAAWRLMRAVWCEVCPSISALVPSILLCINPALYFTLFDCIKAQMLLLRPSSRSREPEESNRLSSSEAFWAGFLAKILCTLLTYPFIRAKVLVITGGRDNDGRLTASDASSAAASDPQDADDSVLATIVARLLAVEFMQALQLLARQGSFFSLFQGLPLHMAHAAFRDACSMGLKEHLIRVVSTGRVSKRKKND